MKFKHSLQNNHSNGVSESGSVVLDSLRPQGLYSPWNSPGQNTGVGSCSLLQGIFPTQGSNPGLPHCRKIVYQLSHQGSPPNWVVCSECLLFFYLSTVRMERLVTVVCVCVCMHIHACVSLSLGQVLNKCAYFSLFWILGGGCVWDGGLTRPVHLFPLLRK